MSATRSSSTRPAAHDGAGALLALRGLGPRSAEMLIQVGIVSPGDLRALGAVRAYLRVQAAGLKPSLNLLWALEGAIQDVSWQQVARVDRLRLLMEWDDAVRAAAAVEGQGGSRVGPRARPPKPVVSK